MTKCSQYDDTKNSFWNLEGLNMVQNLCLDYGFLNINVAKKIYVSFKWGTNIFLAGFFCNTSIKLSILDQGLQR